MNGHSAFGATEAAHRAASDRELIAWVDEQDRLLGELPRAQLRARGLIGRGTFIVLFDDQGAPVRAAANAQQGGLPRVLGRGGGRHGSG